MRVAALVITLFGCLIGVMTGMFQVSEPNHLYVWLTMGLSGAGALGGLLLFLRWRFSPWWLLAVAVIGTVPDSILWEGAGSCFLVGALIGFAARNQFKGA